MFHNCTLLNIFSQRPGNSNIPSSSSPADYHYERLDETRQWFYCLYCDVGFGSRDRHQWHLKVCPASRKCHGNYHTFHEHQDRFSSLIHVQHPAEN